MQGEPDKEQVEEQQDLIYPEAYAVDNATVAISRKQYERLLEVLGTSRDFLLGFVSEEDIGPLIENVCDAVFRHDNPDYHDISGKLN